MEAIAALRIWGRTGVAAGGAALLQILSAPTASGLLLRGVGVVRRRSIAAIVCDKGLGRLQGSVEVTAPKEGGRLLIETGVVSCDSIVVWGLPECPEKKVGKGRRVFSNSVDPRSRVKKQV